MQTQTYSSVPSFPDGGRFSHLTSEERYRLFSLAEPVRVKSGTVLFSEGEKTSAVFIISRGAVELGHFHDAQWYATTHLGENDCLGDLNNTHHHTARTTGTCDLLKFDGVDMVHLLMENPDLWCKLCQAVTPSYH